MYQVPVHQWMTLSDLPCDWLTEVPMSQLIASCDSRINNTKVLLHLPHHSVMSFCDATWRHDVMTPCCDVTPCLVSVRSNQKTVEITFFDLVTLTFDLWLSPLNLSKIWAKSIPVINFVTMGWIEWFSCESANRQTDGTVFITLTADAGGNHNYCTLCMLPSGFLVNLQYPFIHWVSCIRCLSISGWHLVTCPVIGYWDSHVPVDCCQWFLIMHGRPSLS